MLCNYSFQERAFTSGLNRPAITLKKNNNSNIGYMQVYINNSCYRYEYKVYMDKNLKK